jgi:hypothetical protein
MIINEQHCHHRHFRRAHRVYQQRVAHTTIMCKRVALMVSKEVCRRAQRTLRQARTDVPFRAKKLAKEITTRWKRYEKDVCNQLIGLLCFQFLKV